MKHPGHTYGGFVPAISEQGMTHGLVFIWFQEHRCQIEAFQEITRKIGIPKKNKCHHGNAPDTMRQCAKASDQWAQVVASQPNSLVGQSHLAASLGFAS
jgi:hypothetical protein